MDVRSFARFLRGDVTPAGARLRATRAKTRLDSRHETRRRTLEGRRRIVQPQSEDAAAPSDARRRQLDEWLKRRADLKKSQPKKKPPFKVGLVKHAPATFEPPPPPIVNRRVTRSATRAANPQKQQQSRIPPQPTAPPIHSVKKVQVSFAPIGAEFRPPKIRRLAATPRIVRHDSSRPSIFSAFLNDPEAAVPEEKTTPVRNVYISPYVTVTRGKNKTPSPDSEPEQCLGKTANYFRLQLNGEIERLNQLCETWKNCMAENTLDEDKKGLIDVAIGQTQLLINKKFEQFRGLIKRCENQEIVEGEGLVNVDDLQGFWDMVYMQVENIDIRFNNLKKLKENNWIDEEKSNITKKKVVKINKPVAKDVKVSSGLRAMISAARKKAIPEPIPIQKDNLEVKQLIEFNGGFFTVTSPAKSENTNATPMRKSLVRTVVSSEANKKLSTQTPAKVNALLMANSYAKCVANNMEIPVILVETAKNLAPIDLNKTPGKSILKTPITNSIHNQSTSKKNVKVLFSPACENSDLDFKKIIIEEPSNDEEDKEITFDSSFNELNSSESSKELRQRKISGSPLNELKQNEPIRRSSRLQTPSTTKTIGRSQIDELSEKLEDSFLEFVGAKSGKNRKSNRNSIKRNKENNSNTNDFITFESPCEPAYMTRSMAKRISNVLKLDET